MLISIALVNWNSYELLDACLRSLIRSRIPTPFDVIVVDNSQDGPRRAAVFPDSPVPIRWLLNDTNLGFAAGNNQAIQVAASEFILLLNPDTLVGVNAVSHLLEAITKNPRVAILGACLINVDGSQQTSSYGLYPSLLGAAVDALLLPYLSRRVVLSRRRQHPIPRRVAWVKGACLLIRRLALAEIGPLDEGFFMYCEDADWCHRAQRAGWEVATLDTARVVHLGQGSAGFNQLASITAYYEAYERFVLKHQGPGRFDWRRRTVRTALKLAAAIRLVGLTLLHVIDSRRADGPRQAYVDYLLGGRSGFHVGRST